ncbi:MAG: NAD-dependent epimerase/dehydratase family protein, partial [Tatlockia sp.]|nr:NAD-dependent epimerase/dehydratase family protein [Tatlockia sp.]
ISGDKQLVVWGSGKQMREFLHVDDMADACLFLMEKQGRDMIFNIGSGVDISIRELAEIIMDVVGFKGEIVFDSTKPDGTPRKLLNVERMKNLGWTAQTNLREGIAKTYQDFLNHEHR